MTAKDNLLGISGSITAKEKDQLIQCLSEAWEVVFKKPVGKLEDDLEATHRWFNPVARGQRLRREIAKLATMPTGPADLEPPLTVRLEEGKSLVTPEGRCVLDLLQGLPQGQAIHNVTQAEIVPYERQLAKLYRRWSRHRLNSVVSLLKGTYRPIQIPAAGIVVALLVNRSTSADRALIRFTSDPERSVVDRAFFAPIQAFSDILWPERRKSEISAHLITGWMVYEVRRRIGSAVVLNNEGEGQNDSLWIDSEYESSVIEVVARDLVRGHRARVGKDLFLQAFDGLVAELRRTSKALAGFGLAHERPRNTTRLRNLFADRLSHHEKARV